MTKLYLDESLLPQPNPDTRREVYARLVKQCRDLDLPVNHTFGMSLDRAIEALREALYDAQHKHI